MTSATALWLRWWGNMRCSTVWNSHLYVLYGAIYDETLYSDGTRMNVIHKLLLIDPRFSDARREVVFNRDTDDWTKFEGMLQLTAAPQ